MADSDLAPLLADFRDALLACRRLYARAARDWAAGQRGVGSREACELAALMDDLHRGLLIKIYVAVTEADRTWSHAERRLGEALLEHVWGQRLTGPDLRDAVRHVFDQSARLRWRSVVGPFARNDLLHERAAELRTIVTRVANLVAKADGTVHPAEQARLASIEVELDNVLQAVPLAIGAGGDSESSDVADNNMTGGVDYNQPNHGELRTLEKAAAEVRERCVLEPVSQSTVAPPSPDQLLADTLAELDHLVGLEPIKHEVRTLVNYLKVQDQRQKAGLPTGRVSLHMVFTGNPGTGKTTVARLVGRILGAMGILAKGHLVETDRSGLVASYAGQTGPRTHKKIDEALDGVLFIDEAYSLVAQESEDPYGAEAVQTLLKRMEDDRHRLVVILAGYPEPMDRLLRSNPGLSSRFSRQLSFPDYSTVELCRLFQGMCRQSQYTIAPAARAKLALGFAWLLTHRDEHFGNGRLVRNTFEMATRRMANRIVGMAPLTRQLLTRFAPEDIDLPGVPFTRDERLTVDGARFLVACPGCGHQSRVRGEHLGRRVRCRRCARQFRADWGEPLVA